MPRFQSSGESRGGVTSRRALGERGAAAIEFALVFPLFFILLYSLVSWGLLLTLQGSMSHAAQVAARVSLAADPRHEDYEAIMQQLARDTAGEVLVWLPEPWKARVLGAGNERVEVTRHTEEGVDWVKVRLVWPDFRNDPMLPVLRLPGEATLPPLPAQLQGEAVIRL